LDQDGRINTITKLIIGILDIVGIIESIQMKECQAKGIRIAKKRDVYKFKKLAPEKAY